MKKFTFLLLFLSITLMAQNYPNKMPELLLGKQVKIIESQMSSNPKYGYTHFFADTLPKQYMPNGRGYSERTALLGKQFTVTEIRDKTPKKARPMYRVKLEAPDKSVVYYHYSPSRGPSDYPFEVIGGLDYPPDFYCSYLEKDELTNNERYIAQLENGSLTKNVVDGKISYSLEVVEFLVSEGKMEKGIALILDNDKYITYKDAVVIPSYHNGKEYKYRRDFDLTAKEIELLKKHKILGVRIADKVIKMPNGEKLQEILKCETK